MPTCPAAPRDTYAEATRPDQSRPDVEVGVRSRAPARALRGLSRRRQDRRDRGAAVRGRVAARGQDLSVRRARDRRRTARARTRPAARITTPPSRAFEIGPYLQQLTATGAAVVWQTYEPATTALAFGPAGGPLQVVQRDADADPPACGRRCRSSRRRPRTSTAGSPTASWATSRASPPRPASPRDFSFGVIGDFGIGTPAARANLRRLSQDPRLDFAITTGDNAQIYGTEEEYRSFVLGPLRELIATKPFWPSVGNHDYYNLQNYKRFFALPNGGLHYSFTYGGVLFLSLDSNRFDSAPAALAARRAARVKRALQGRVLPPPAVVERPRISRPRPASAPQPLRADPAARRGRPRPQRPPAELRALQATALGTAQPQGDRLRRDGRWRGKAQRIRDQAQAEVVGAPRRLPPPASHQRRRSRVPRPRDRRGREHS